MSPRISAERREQYLQERRDVILDAAIQVFGEKGFDGASVADIAEAAGLGKGTMYLYFESKEDIFSAILAEQVYREVILKETEMVASFLSAQAKAGRIRPLDDPFLTAQAFMGMLTTYVLTQEMLGGKNFAPIKKEAWVREVVRLFLEGVWPQESQGITSEAEVLCGLLGKVAPGREGRGNGPHTARRGEQP